MDGPAGLEMRIALNAQARSHRRPAAAIRRLREDFCRRLEGERKLASHNRPVCRVGGRGLHLRAPQHNNCMCISQATGRTADVM